LLFFLLAESLESKPPFAGGGIVGRHLAGGFQQVAERLESLGGRSRSVDLDLPEDTRFERIITEHGTVSQLK